MDVQFNTDRSYTSEGQVVRAQLIADEEKIIFADYSRGITGAIVCPTWDQGFRTPSGLATYTMKAYDRGEYSYDQRAAMLPRNADAPTHHFGL
jgi:hypothetical protein